MCIWCAPPWWPRHDSANRVESVSIHTHHWSLVQYIYHRIQQKIYSNCHPKSFPCRFHSIVRLLEIRCLCHFALQFRRRGSVKYESNRIGVVSSSGDGCVRRPSSSYHTMICDFNYTQIYVPLKCFCYYKYSVTISGIPWQISFHSLLPPSNHSFCLFLFGQLIVGSPQTLRLYCYRMRCLAFMDAG